MPTPLYTISEKTIDDCLEIMNGEDVLSAGWLKAWNIINQVDSKFWSHLVARLRSNLKPDVSSRIISIIGIWNLHHKADYIRYTKNYPITLEDLESYKTSFEAHDALRLLCLASVNKNGYVRERAVDMLAESGDGKAIEFLIYRLNDNVPAVQRKAAEHLKGFLDEKYIGELILWSFILNNSIPRNTLSQAIHERVEDFIFTRYRAQVADNIFDYFNKLHSQYYSHKSLFLKAITFSFDQLLTCEDTRTPEFLIKLIKYPSERSKLMALRYPNKLEGYFKNESYKKMRDLLRDSSVAVCLQIFPYLKERSDFKQLMLEHTSARAKPLRDYTRQTLNLDSRNAAIIYLENLRNNRRLAGSLLGLCDLESKDYVEAVKPFLEHRFASIRALARKYCRMSGGCF